MKFDHLIIKCLEDHWVLSSIPWQNASLQNYESFSTWRLNLHWNRSLNTAKFKINIHRIVTQWKNLHNPVGCDFSSRYFKPLEDARLVSSDTIVVRYLSSITSSCYEETKTNYICIATFYSRKALLNTVFLGCFSFCFCFLILCCSLKKPHQKSDYGRSDFEYCWATWLHMHDMTSKIPLK